MTLYYKSAVGQGNNILLFFFKIITVIYVLILKEKFPYKYNDGETIGFFFKFYIIFISSESLITYHYKNLINDGLFLY